MAQNFILKLVTPTGVMFDGEVEQVDAVGPLGEFGVLADHVNLITSLTAGILGLRRPDGERDYYLITGGLAEVKNGAITVLADEAETIREADEEALRREANEAEHALGQLSVYGAEWYEAAEALAQVRARIRASELHRMLASQ